MGFSVGAMAQETKAPAPAKKAAVKQEPQLWSAGDIKWVDIPDMKGGQKAVLWGDPNTGAYGAMLKFPAGLDIPLHWHTYRNRGALLSGTMAIALEGGTPKELGAGSYLMMPGRVKHSTMCKAGADCVVFVEQPGKDDIHLVEAAPKK